MFHDLRFLKRRQYQQTTFAVHIKLNKLSSFVFVALNINTIKKEEKALSKYYMKKETLILNCLR